MTATLMANENVLNNNSGMRVVHSRRQTAPSAETAENNTYSRGKVISAARKKAAMMNGDGMRTRERGKVSGGLAEANGFNHGHRRVAKCC